MFAFEVTFYTFVQQFFQCALFYKLKNFFEIFILNIFRMSYCWRDIKNFKATIRTNTIVHPDEKFH